MKHPKRDWKKRITKTTKWGCRRKHPKRDWKVVCWLLLFCCSVKHPKRDWKSKIAIQQCLSCTTWSIQKGIERTTSPVGIRRRLSRNITQKHPKRDWKDYITFCREVFIRHEASKKGLKVLRGSAWVAGNTLEASKKGLKDNTYIAYQQGKKSEASKKGLKDCTKGYLKFSTWLKHPKRDWKPTTTIGTFATRNKKHPKRDWKKSIIEVENDGIWDEASKKGLKV